MNQKLLHRASFTSAGITICLAFTSCTRIHHWMDERDHRAQADQAEIHENPSPQPVAAVYIVDTGDGSAKEITMFFSGKSKARLLQGSEAGSPKAIVDYEMGTISRISKTGKIDEQPIEPSVVPPVFDAHSAMSADAIATGSGVFKEHEYHRWIKNLGNGKKWEAWIDDDGAFPVYFQTMESGRTITWNLRNAWVDQSLLDRPEFFDITKPDRKPSTPAPEADQG